MCDNGADLLNLDAFINDEIKKVLNKHSDT